MIKSPQMFRYLDVSTSHITHHDDDILKDMAIRNISENARKVSMMGVDNYFIIVYPTAHGYFVFVNSEDTGESYTRRGLSPEFQEIMRQAASLECSFVRFDADGTVYQNLPVFKW